MGNPDKYHYHELMDRVHIINSMIDDFLIEHPATTSKMARHCEEAQELLNKVTGQAGLLRDRLRN